MTRILDKFNRRKNPYVSADGLNHEGFPTFKRSNHEAYLQVLLTNTLSGTFYASEEKLLGESLALHAEMSQSDPQFAARALVYARNEGLMRLQPIVGLAYLAKADHALFHQIFNRVIQTPGDLTDFVEIIRGDVTPGGMGRSVKRAVNGWLNKMSEYHAIKYGAGGQGYSLRDILRVSHPKPTNETQDMIFLWLTDHDKWQAADKAMLTPQITAFEAIKRLDLSNGQESARAMIAEGKLPYEVVTGVMKPDVETWAALMSQMPYMALMRHLNTLQRAGVLKIEANAHYVASRLVDVNAVRKAKVLPFRLFMAYQMFKAEDPNERVISEALAQAMDVTFENLPNLGGRVCIAPDVSGSMSGRMNAQSQTTYIQIAGVFAGALVKKAGNAVILPFNHQVVDVQLNGRDSIMTNAEKVAKLCGGGTAISAPISELLAKKIKVDTFIGITDSEEWARDQYGGHGFLKVWNEYKDKVAPTAKAFLVTIAPYRHAVAPQDAPDIHYIYGWSDSVLKYINLAIAGVASQAAEVQNLVI